MVPRSYDRTSGTDMSRLFGEEDALALAMKGRSPDDDAEEDEDDLDEEDEDFDPDLDEEDEDLLDDDEEE
jgi:hypothetical protein